MAEGAIMSKIEKLQDMLLVDRNIDPQLVGMLISDMEMLVSLVREKKLKHASSRLNDLKYLAEDLSFKPELHVINDILHELGTRSQNVGVGEVVGLEGDVECSLEVGEGSQNIGIGEVVGFEGDVKCSLELGEGSQNDVQEVVGLEEDVKCFLDKINYKPLVMEIGGFDIRLNHKSFVARIDGITGSGKTTLARQLINHAEVVRNFMPCVWVDCTEILNLKELLINLILRLESNNYEDMKKMENTHLLSRLNQQLQNKRFFIVLDHSKSWMCKKIFSALRSQAKGRSMLLFIFRDRKHRSFSDYHHEMQLLDQDNSWKLLLKVLFSGINKFPKHVERKAKAMLMKHSGGLPLAIKELAMEWAEKRQTGAEWEDVVESEDLKLRASLEALESTVYRHLGPHMKSFFLHLGFFKLSTVIREQRLELTLVASGILGEKKYYNHLLKCIVEERMIEIKENSKDSKAKNVHVRSIFHKLSIAKLRSSDEGVSYCAIYYNREGFNCLSDQSERLLCVSFNGGGCFDDGLLYWKCFKQLRVLDFEDFGLKFLPETVGDLIELRYLGLRNNYIPELPHSLGNLKNLEVLDIAFNFMMKVPDIICEMESLVHLYMSDIICMKPLKIEALQNLKTLTYISVDNWTYDMLNLQRMTSLNKLGIEGLDGNSDVRRLFASLAGLKKLDCLVLRGFRFRSMPKLDELSFLNGLRELKLDGFITMPPSHENFPPKLVYLTLANNYLDHDPMPVLEKLECLEYLKLQNAYTGEQMVISKNGFSKLKKMCIEELWQLRNIKVALGGLKRLLKLEITTCPCLSNLPNGITTKSNMNLKMVTTMKIATQVKEWEIFSKSRHPAIILGACQI